MRRRGVRREVVRRAHPWRSVRAVGLLWTEGFLELDGPVLGGTRAILLPTLGFVDRLTS